MALAVCGTLLHPEIVTYKWIAAAFAAGILVGVPLSWVPLTAVPQRTALSHAFGGLAAGLVGTAKYYLWLGGEAGTAEGLTAFRTGAIVVEVILGFLTFTGSLMAAGKLQEVLPTRPVTYKNQNILNFTLLGITLAAGVVLVIQPQWSFLFPLLIGLALTFGVLLILPIGGADMPTVISLLNSYAGLSAVAMDSCWKTSSSSRRARSMDIGPHPLDHHVQGDEPLVHQRPLRGFRPAQASTAQAVERTVRSAAPDEAALHPRDGQGSHRDSRLRHGGRSSAAHGT